MATKYLARTIIEGGRAHFNQWERNYSHRRERAATREFLAKASAAHDGFDRVSAPTRDKVRKEFSDKLGAPRRWLEAQVGRPWDKVHAEIFSRFDPRTLAGRHIIFDHLLQEVTIHAEHSRWFCTRYGLYVDRHGILRNRSYKHERSSPRHWRLPDAVREWAGGRRVADAGRALFWLDEAGACESCHAWRRSPCCCPMVKGAPAHGPHVHYRQGAHLSRDDIARWHSFDASLQELLRGPRHPKAR